MPMNAAAVALLNSPMFRTEPDGSTWLAWILRDSGVDTIYRIPPERKGHEMGKGCHRVTHVLQTGGVLVDEPGLDDTFPPSTLC